MTTERLNLLVVCDWGTIGIKSMDPESRNVYPLKDESDWNHFHIGYGLCMPQGFPDPSRHVSGPLDHFSHARFSLESKISFGRPVWPPDYSIEGWYSVNIPQVQARNLLGQFYNLQWFLHKWLGSWTLHTEVQDWKWALKLVSHSCPGEFIILIVT